MCRKRHFRCLTMGLNLLHAVPVEKGFVDRIRHRGAGRRARRYCLLSPICPRSRKSYHMAYHGNCRIVWRHHLDTCLPSLLRDNCVSLVDSKRLAEVSDPIINDRDGSTHAKPVKCTGLVARPASNRLQEKQQTSHRLDLSRGQVTFSTRTHATRRRSGA